MIILIVYDSVHRFNMTNEELNKWISDYHGMELTPIAEVGERHNENGVLFFAEYLILKFIKGQLVNSDIARFQTIVENITAYSSPSSRVKGLYDRGAGESLWDNKSSIRKISHDNITAISAISRLFESEGLAYHKDIAIHGVKWQMRYDNRYPKSPEWIFKKYNDQYDTSFQYHPRDWFFWLHSYYKIAWLFFPFFFIANVVTCLTPKEETSGKWLMFVRLETGSRWSRLMMVNKKICYWILRKKYGDDFIDKMAQIYFWQRGNSPIRKLTKGLKLK